MSVDAERGKWYLSPFSAKKNLFSFMALCLNKKKVVNNACVLIFFFLGIKTNINLWCSFVRIMICCFSSVKSGWLLLVFYCKIAVGTGSPFAKFAWCCSRCTEEFTWECLDESVRSIKGTLCSMWFGTTGVSSNRKKGRRIHVSVYDSLFLRSLLPHGLTILIMHFACVLQFMSGRQCASL